MRTKKYDMSLSDIADIMRGGTETRDHSGVHVTDLYWEGQRIAKGKARPDYSAVEGIADMGRIWEYVVHKWLLKSEGDPVHVIFSPTYELEGVKGSLDAIIIGLVEPIVVEAKLKFGNTIEPQERHDWMFQVKAYCKMTGARWVWMPILYILSAPPRCIPILYELGFTDTEIEENWSMMQNIKRHVEGGDTRNPWGER